MESLGNIIGSKKFDEPPEIRAIKDFVMREFSSVVGVSIRERDIVIVVPGASLANSIRLRIPELKKRCSITKRVTLQIG
jgi:hypothetical protein